MKKNLFLSFFFLFVAGVFLVAKTANAEGTYYNIGTASSNNGGYDSVSWSQGYPIIIDAYGHYLVPIQQSGQTLLHIAYSNDKGDTWSQVTPISPSIYNRSAVVYDTIHDKLHVVGDGGTESADYKRYIINRDKDYNIVGISADPTLTPVSLDQNAGAECAGIDFNNPILLFKDDGADGILTAFWSVVKTNCGGTTISQTRASMINLSNDATDGNASNWKALDGTTDASTTVGDAFVDFDVLTTSSVAGNRQHSATIRGGSGAKANDIYYFNTDENGFNGFTRLTWNSSNNNWSGASSIRTTFGGFIGNNNGYPLKDELISKPIYATSHDKVYVGIATWLDGVNGDTQRLYSVDSSDNISLVSNVYSAGGTHCLYPTFDIAYDSVESKLYFFYIISGASSVCGNTYYKTFDGSSWSSAQAYYTVADRSVDIPVTYQYRENDRIILFYRLNNAADASTPPHEIHFGYVGLGQTATSDYLQITSPYSASTVTDFDKSCAIISDSNFTDTGGGEITTEHTFRDDFYAPRSPYESYDASIWDPGTYGGGSYTPLYSNTLLVKNATTGGANIFSNTSFLPARTLEFRAKFTAHNHQHIGFAQDEGFGRYAMFSTGNAASLRTRVSNGSETFTEQGTSYLGDFHLYKIVWTESNVEFYIDNVLVETTTTNVPSATMKIMASNNTDGAGSDLTIDWIKLSTLSTTGSYTSCILDSQYSSTDWGNITYNSILPGSTSLTAKVRTSADRINWSSWSSAITSGEALTSSQNRYAQLLFDFAGTTTATAELTDFGFTFAEYIPPTSTPTNTATPTPTATFTPTPTATISPTPTTASGSSSASSASTSSPGNVSTPVCEDLSPGSKSPQIYAASATSTNSIKLYFADGDKPITHYTLAFGKSENDMEYGLTNIGPFGMREYEVSELRSSTTYYFKIQGKNGCASGEWSNIIPAKTLGALDTSSLITESTNDSDQNSAIEDPKETKNILKEVNAEKNDDKEEKYTKVQITLEIKDNNNLPVKGAKVTLYSEPRSGITDDYGKVTFEDVEVGNHTVAIEHKDLNGNQAVFIEGNKPTYEISITVKEKRNYLLYFIGAFLLITTSAILIISWYKRSSRMNESIN